MFFILLNLSTYQLKYVKKPSGFYELYKKVKKFLRSFVEFVDKSFDF